MSPGGGAGARHLTSPQEVVERALAASVAEGCVVIVEELSQAEVRFANNTTTTNGVRRDRRVVVVSFRAVGSDGSRGFARLAVGVASGSGEVEVTDLVRASEVEAAGAAPADDAAPLIEPDGPLSPPGASGMSGASTGFDEPPVPTSPAVLGGVIRGLGDAFARARSAGNRLAGFATHGVDTV